MFQESRNLAQALVKLIPMGGTFCAVWMSCGVWIWGSMVEALCGLKSQMIETPRSPWTRLFPFPQSQSLREVALNRINAVVLHVSCKSFFFINFMQSVVSNKSPISSRRMG